MSTIFQLLKFFVTKIFLWLKFFTPKITQRLHTQNHTTSQNKHRENRKTLPWEHHIGCQMCQIALSKRTKKVFFSSSDSSDSIDISEKNHATSPQKNHATSQLLFLIFKIFNTFRKSNLTHWTTDVMFSGQRFVILAMFSYCFLLSSSYFFLPTP